MEYNALKGCIDGPFATQDTLNAAYSGIATVATNPGPDSSFQCDPSKHRTFSKFNLSTAYCHNCVPGAARCPYRGNEIPFQTGPSSVDGRKRECRRR